MQSKSRAAWLGMAGAVLLVAAGCGDGDGDGGGGGGGGGQTGTTKPSGVTSSKPLADVTDAEAMQLCEWAIDAAYTPSDKEACTFGASLFSSTEAECEATVAECLKNGATGEDDEEESCDDAKNDLPDNCSATVAELEACIKDSNAALRAFFAGASCAKLGTIGAAPGEQPASCLLIEEKCPGAFGDDDDFDDGGAGGGGGSFACADGESIPDVFACDGEADCADGSDEASCP